MENLRQGMVSIYMAYILKGEEILVKGSPDRYRDLVYIDDVIDAYMMCLESTNSYGKAYNVASGVRTHVRELLNAELKAFGYEPSDYPIRFADSTPGDTFGIDADIKTIKDDIGWQPRVQLNEGLKKMAEWAISIKSGT